MIDEITPDVEPGPAPEPETGLRPEIDTLARLSDEGYLSPVQLAARLIPLALRLAEDFTPDPALMAAVTRLAQPGEIGDDASEALLDWIAALRERAEAISDWGFEAARTAVISALADVFLAQADAAIDALLLSVSA